MSHLESPITPSIGRIVLVRGGLIDPVNRDAEYPAIITRVWGQNNLSVQVFGSNTSAHLEGVKFDSDSAASIDYAAWRWMDYQVQTAKDREPQKVDPIPSIPLTPFEIQSGLDRVRWAEGLIRQLPEHHDGRNTWLLNYGTKAEPVDVGAR